MQIVERAYGLLELHAFDQGEVRAAAAAILAQAGTGETDRLAPRVLSREIITGIDGHQSAMINRMRHGEMLLDGQTLYTLEVHPAGYAAFAANEAEKRAEVSMLEMVTFGAVGRVWLGGARRRSGRPRRPSTPRWPRSRAAPPEAPAMSARRDRGRPTSPLDAIDAALAERLLAAALGSGGDYADLYFEYRSGADFVLEDGRVRTVGRGVTLGLGVRVLRGDATGYAYTEELAEDRMLEAARTAAQIASSGARARADRDAAGGAGRLLSGHRAVAGARRAPTRSRCSGAPTRPRAPSIRASCASRPRWPRSSARCWW